MGERRGEARSSDIVGIGLSVCVNFCWAIVAEKSISWAGSTPPTHAVCPLGYQGPIARAQITSGQILDLQLAAPQNIINVGVATPTAPHEHKKQYKGIDRNLTLEFAPEPSPGNPFASVITR